MAGWLDEDLRRWMWDGGANAIVGFGLSGWVDGGGEDGQHEATLQHHLSRLLQPLGGDDCGIVGTSTGAWASLRWGGCPPALAIA